MQPQPLKDAAGFDKYELHAIARDCIMSMEQNPDIGAVSRMPRWAPKCGVDRKYYSLAFDAVARKCGLPGSYYDYDVAFDVTPDSVRWLMSESGGRRKVSIYNVLPNNQGGMTSLGGVALVRYLSGTTMKVIWHTGTKLGTECIHVEADSIPSDVEDGE